MTQSETWPLPPHNSDEQTLMQRDERSHMRLERLTRIGMAGVAILVFGLGGLAALVPISGAVIAQGVVTVEGQVKRIAHPSGGVVAQIAVHDGQHVEKGQVLLRLDNTVLGASARYSALGLDQLLARAARLRAQSEGRSQIEFPAELTGRSGQRQVAIIMEDEREALQLAARAQDDQQRQLHARIAQAQADVRRARSDAQSYRSQQDLIGRELDQTRELYEKRLTTMDRLGALERSALGVTASQRTAREEALSAQARIAETQAQLASTQSSARASAAVELGQVEAAIAEERQRVAGAHDQDNRAAIRAPISGTVDKLALNTIGGVARPGETLLEIVPDAAPLMVEVHVPVTEVDRIGVGGKAVLHFSALNVRTTPELEGQVTQIGADRTVDQATGAAWYVARIAIPRAQLARLDGQVLKVGMPAEVFIDTGQRSLMAYILRPLSDQFKRALRE